MQFGKRIAVLALGAALTLSMTACSSTENKDDSSGDISTAMEKLNAVSSLDATMVMEMNMSVMEQPMETKTTMNMSCFNDPHEAEGRHDHGHGRPGRRGYEHVCRHGR